MVSLLYLAFAMLMSALFVVIYYKDLLQKLLGIHLLFQSLLVFTIIFSKEAKRELGAIICISLLFMNLCVVLVGATLALQRKKRDPNLIERGIE